VHLNAWARRIAQFIRATNALPMAEIGEAMKRKRIATLIALAALAPGLTGAGSSGPQRAVVVAQRYPQPPSRGVQRPQPPPDRQGRANGPRLFIPGLTAAGLAAWALSDKHAPRLEQPRPQDHTAPKPVVLTGTVTDDSGRRLVSAGVELLSKTATREPARRVRAIAQSGSGAYVPQAYVETDVNGRYSILSKLRDGVHVLVVSAVDHSLQQVALNVTNETHLIKNIVLHQPDAAATPQPYDQRQIFYATDRAPDDRAARFGYANVARNAPGVAAGRATVSVAHSDPAAAQFPPRMYTRVSRSGAGQAVVDDVSRPLAADAFSSALIAEAVRSRSRSILIYIHGYNQSFDDGVRDAAQFQYETGLDAAVLAYSWPSAHDLLKYAVDEDSNSASSNNFVQFVGPLKAAAARARVRMMIVAHSMGNRIAVRGFEMLPDCVDAAALAAPDVYSRELTNGLPLVRKGVKRVTIYASRTDQALLLSNVFHQDYRVGLFENDPFIATGMDTIDATAADTSMLGHSYYLESEIVAADIARFLSGAAPPARPHLRPKAVETFNYWAIVRP
jgi:esterase/lipase superfamily enzyme